MSSVAVTITAVAVVAKITIAKAITLFMINYAKITLKIFLISLSFEI